MLEEIRELLALAEHGTHVAETVRDRAKKKVQQIEAEIARLCGMRDWLKPTHEMPSDIFFEVTGVLQFFAALVAARACLALWRGRQASAPSLERRPFSSSGTTLSLVFLGTRFNLTGTQSWLYW